MFLLNGLYRAARALYNPLKLGEYPVIMSVSICRESSAFEEVTLISQYTSEAQVKNEPSVKQSSVGSTESELPGKDTLSEQDKLIHSLHQDACKVSGKRLL